MEDAQFVLSSNKDDRVVGLNINHKLNGDIIGVGKNVAHTRFIPTEDMVIDSRLIHNGFIFSAAAYAASVALNKKNSILIGSDVKFLAPTELGHEIVFKATALQDDTKKCEVKVEGYLLDIKIFYGMFFIAVFNKKIFKLKFNEDD